MFLLIYVVQGTRGTSSSSPHNLLSSLAPSPHNLLFSMLHSSFSSPTGCRAQSAKDWFPVLIFASLRTIASLPTRGTITPCARALLLILLSMFIFLCSLRQNVILAQSARTEFLFHVLSSITPDTIPAQPFGRLFHSVKHFAYPLLTLSLPPL